MNEGGGAGRQRGRMKESPSLTANQTGLGNDIQDTARFRPDSWEIQAEM